MRRIKQFISSLVATTALTSAVLVAGLSGNASALACYQYNANGFTTSTTPVFNNICGITATVASTSGSYAFGNEANFVRIRPETSTDPTSADNPPLQDNLTTACNDGDEFEIFTYIHNDASSDYNDNGSGSAIAKNVKLDLDAPGVNTTGDHFTFTGTVSADNAATATDSTYLDCNGQQVKLTLVPGSVYYDNTTTGAGTYNSLPDTDVNTTFPVGAPNWPTTGQEGIEWGCWDYRIVVVYTVEVQPVTTTTTTTTTPPTTTTTTPTTPTTPTTTTTTSSTTPTQLVNTGPGDVIAIFAAVVIASTLSYRYYLGRRLSRQ